MRKILIGLALLTVSSAAQARIFGVCYGTQHKFRIYLAKNTEDLNRPYELLMKKGLKGTGPVIYRAQMMPVQKIDEKLPNVEFSYNILADTGGFEVLRFAGKIAKYRPVDPRTGVSFRAPMTNLWLNVKGMKLNEILRCRFR